MRYRRLSVRRTRVTGYSPLWTFAEVWRSEQTLFFWQGQWRPDADMCETSGTVEVSIDLAGVGEEDFEIQLFEDALVVDGRRHIQTCGDGGVYQVAGIRQGPFRLELALPSPIDAEKVEARYDRGLLRIRLPKREVIG
jgi:HSP20 family protein